MNVMINIWSIEYWWTYFEWRYIYDILIISCRRIITHPIDVSSKWGREINNREIERELMVRIVICKANIDVEIRAIAVLWCESMHMSVEGKVNLWSRDWRMCPSSMLTLTGPILLFCRERALKLFKLYICQFTAKYSTSDCQRWLATLRNLKHLRVTVFWLIWRLL